ncbi:unnamed protein product [Mytilus coruscus]|uniref:Uncharacterized protein n=1 Tax=Mytilus coruscus TaxID=42192 RepID=A0A6J8AWV8_MYTCO|nr:unnamed protein product [Mytilus coruscus]
MKKKSANKPDRQSRQRVKIVRENSHEVQDTNYGNVIVPLPENGRRSRSRSASSKSRSDSSSSFWSSGSQDRARLVKTFSRSRSNSRSSRSSYSRSRSCSRTSSSCSSSSRSRSPSVEYSRKKVRERSKSPPTPKSPVKEPRSDSLSSIQSAPVKTTIERHEKVNHDSASDSGRKGKRKKLLKRGEVRKYRSFDINPDIFIEERIKQKYKELHNLMATQFSGTHAQMTQHQFQQMHSLRDQYVSASHGLPPSGILVPRSLPASMRVKRGAPQGLTKVRSRSKDTLTSDFGEDRTYVSVQRVQNTSAAREGKVIVDPHPVMIKKKKKKVKKSDSETKLNSTLDSTSDLTGSRMLSPRSRSDYSGSRTLSPRSRSKEPEIHHIKASKNPDLIKWLKQKDKDHRKKEKEERKKKREEREKLVLEANEKFERRLESQKIVKKWISEKEKDYKKYLKEKKRQERELEMQERIRIELSSPTRGITVRSQTAPSQWKQKNGNSPYKTKNEKISGEAIDVTGSTAQTVQDQLGTSSEHLKFDLNDQKSHDPLPPTSKFMYKRPVAGKIKLNMRNRPMSAQPKLQSTRTEKEHWQSAKDESDRNLRMTYDDWINTKRKEDKEKRKQEKIRQKEVLSKSDPEIAKIVPEVAKKRIHTMLNERKSIDTGIKRYDVSANRSFGGGSFDGSKSPKPPSKTHSYKLADDRPGTAKDRTVESLKVSGRIYQRPGTAPAAGRKVPVPMRSPYSPVPASAPAHVEEIMNSEDQANPFVLPFPPEQGVPKHLASMQKKLFSEETLRKSDQIEPQGGDVSTDLVPLNDDVEHTSSSEDIKYDNINTKDKSHDSKTEEKIGNDTQYVNGNSDENGTKKEENIEETDQPSQTNKERQNGNLDTHLDLPEELNNADFQKSEVNENEQTLGYDEVDSNRTDNKTEENSDEKKDGNERQDDNPLNQSSKHVSFCEEPEVFVNQEEPEWSTDTETPDEDNSRYTTKEDLSTLIDTCGQLLNKEYGDSYNEGNSEGERRG